MAKATLASVKAAVVQQVTDLVTRNAAAVAASDDEDDIWENYLIGFVETGIEALGLEPESRAFESAFGAVHKAYLAARKKAVAAASPAKSAPRSRGKFAATASKALV